MAKRKIVEIDHELCNGCGECIPNCHEGALKIIDGKARLISDYFCDGLGACLGHCPMGAITILEREAEDYNEAKVMEQIVKQGANTIKAHLMHLKDHNEVNLFNQAVQYLKQNGIEIPDLDQVDNLPCGCPGSIMAEFNKSSNDQNNVDISSELTQWPIQLHLVPSYAPFLNNSHLLIAADCTGFAFGNLHQQFIRNKKLIIACPKLDNTEPYLNKLVEMFKNNNIKSVTVLIMEVPCCGGLYRLVEEAVKLSGKQIPLIKEVISTHGEIL